jgi:hypothetical protein
VSCGGQVIADLLYRGLLDETRLTLAGQVVGPLNSQGLPRPRLFPSGSRSYDPHNSPLIAWKGVKTIGEHFVFLRGVYQYRHLSESKSDAIADIA